MVLAQQGLGLTVSPGAFVEWTMWRTAGHPSPLVRLAFLRDNQWYAGLQAFTATACADPLAAEDRALLCALGSKVTARP